MIILGICENASILATILFIKKIVNVIVIAIPAILIVLLTVDFAKAVIAGDEKQMKDVQSQAIKRIIYAVAIFFVPVLANAIFNAVGERGVKGFDCYSNATEEKVDKLAKEQGNGSSTNTVKKEMKETKISEATEVKTTSSTVDPELTGVGGKSSYSGKTNINKTYKTSQTRVLDKLSKDDFYKKSVITTNKNAKVVQSFVVVDNYYVVSAVNHWSTTGYVYVYDKYTLKKVNKFKKSIGHANGMAYNDRNGYIYVTNKAENNKKLHRFPAKNIMSREKLKKDVINLPRGAGGISYDSVTGKMYLLNGGKHAVYEYKYNDETKEKKTKKVVTLLKQTNAKLDDGKKHDGWYQDICVHNNIIYSLRVFDSSKTLAYLDLYNISDGSYLGSYKLHIKSHEFESIDYFGEGDKFALLINHKGNKNNYIYLIDGIMPK